MKNEIVTTAAAEPIPAVLKFLGVGSVTPEDKFSIEYAAGFVTATVNRKDGGVEVVRKHVGGGFTEVSSYDPSMMDREKRNQVINRLRDDGFTQSEIANRIGLTQATVSNVLRRKK